MKKRIRVMLVEDHPDYREIIVLALKKCERIELAGQFGTAERALRSVQDRSSGTTDVVLLDLNLPGMSGLEAIPWFKKYVPSIEIIVLTQSDQESDVLTAISGGASGYLLKSATLDRLEESIQTVFDGGSILEGGVARLLLDVLKEKIPETTEENALTERELEVLTLISQGLVKKEIGDQLGISPKTIAVHCNHIYKKLDVANAPAAVGKAYSLGLLRGRKQSD